MRAANATPPGACGPLANGSCPVREQPRAYTAGYTATGTLAAVMISSISPYSRAAWGVR